MVQLVSPSAGRVVVIGAAFAVVTLGLGGSGRASPADSAVSCIDPTGFSVTDAGGNPLPLPTSRLTGGVTEALPDMTQGDTLFPVRFEQSGGLGSAFYIWSASSPPGLSWSFQGIAKGTQVSEASTQSLSGTATRSGIFRFSVSVREDPGAQPASGVGVALSWPNGHPACPPTTEEFSLMVNPPAGVPKSMVAARTSVGLAAEDLLNLENLEEWNDRELVTADVAAMDKHIKAAEAELPSTKNVPSGEDARLATVKSDLGAALDDAKKIEMTIAEEPALTPASFAPELGQEVVELEAVQEVM